MTRETTMFNFNLPLRFSQLILAIIALGLNGYVTSWYLHHTAPPTTPHSPPYLIFVALFTLLALPYLFLHPVLAGGGAKPNGRLFNKWIILALDALTCLLWFAGFVALGVFQGRLILCGPCDVMVAGVVVGALAWAAFLATTILASLHIMRTRRGPAQQTHAGWVGKQEPVQI